MELYDVLVTGAGPAGCSAALHAARKGLSVLLCEEHPRIGEPVHCGECLSALAVEKFKLKLPQEAIAMSVRGVRVIFPNHSASVLTEPGFVLNKDKFEAWLAGEAQAAGAKLAFPVKIEGLERSDRWRASASNGEFEAELLIDASGVQAFASRKLGLNPPHETVIGLQYRMSDIPTDGYLDFYLWPELAPGGYLWMIPKGDGKANVGLITTDKSNAKKYLDEFVSRMAWENKSVEKAFGGLIPASGPSAKTFGDGLLLVGDAAGFASPLFEGGTHLALKSGELAAEVAAQAVKRNDTTQNILRLYERLWKSEFPDYARMVEGKRAFYAFTQDELNAIGSALPKELSRMSLLDKLVGGLKLLARPSVFTKNIFAAMQSFEMSRAKNYGW
ncbi:MAG: NAD(P)/FAD-dependent oxidoreductase [Candidatus Micrarchaeia archaeon]